MSVCAEVCMKYTDETLLLNILILFEQANLEHYILAQMCTSLLKRSIFRFNIMLAYCFRSRWQWTLASIKRIVTVCSYNQIEFWYTTLNLLWFSINSTNFDVFCIFWKIWISSFNPYHKHQNHSITSNFTIEF